MPMKATLFKNGRIYLDGRFQQGDLLVQDGKIQAFGTLAAADVQQVELDGRLMVPGFIDIHTHGGDGVDVNGADKEGFCQIGRFFASHGVTGWLCSILTDTEEQTLKSIAQARAAMADSEKGAQLLGIHLEGPFLSAQYKGAMPEYLLQSGNENLFHRYQQAAQGAIRYMTVSPEVEGVVEMIAALRGQVAIAIGHSGADYETACAAIDAGACACTHTFNAMGLFHQHRPGIMGAVLERDVYCEAICDGRHLHPGSVRMLLACKGYDRVVAITDSIQAAGLPDGHYKLGVNDVVVVDGDAKLADTGVRAGSTLTMDQALKNLVRFTGQPVERVLPLLTLQPAKVIGMDQAKGSIAPGKDGDLVVLNDALDVMETYIAGVRVYAGKEKQEEN